MESIAELNHKKEELEGRLRNLEEQKTSLEKEISYLIEQIPILDMARYATLLESHTRALKGVRDMLQAVADQETRTGGERGPLQPSR